jgi:hypothetical protein
MSTLLRTLPVLVALAGAAACSGGTDTSGSPAKLQPASTAPLSGPPGRLLTDSVRVKVLTEDDRPVANVSVQWVPKIGGGTAGAGTTTTNADGVSANSWQLGPAEGGQTMEVTVPGTGIPALTLTATAQTPGGGGDGDGGQP